MHEDKKYNDQSGPSSVWHRHPKVVRCHSDTAYRAAERTMTNLRPHKTEVRVQASMRAEKRGV